VSKKTADNSLGADCFLATEVADHFRVSVKVVNKWRKLGLLVGYWTGRQYVYEPKAVERLKGKLCKLQKSQGEQK